MPRPQTVFNHETGGDDVSRVTIVMHHCRRSATAAAATSTSPRPRPFAPSRLTYVVVCSVDDFRASTPKARKKCTRWQRPGYVLDLP